MNRERTDGVAGLDGAGIGEIATNGSIATQLGAAFNLCRCFDTGARVACVTHDQCSALDIGQTGVSIDAVESQRARADLDQRTARRRRVSELSGDATAARAIVDHA
jgi:hypothetical protein